MPARLLPLNDPTLSPIPLQRPVLLIGRHLECDVRLERAQISRRHCCVALAYDRLTIRDLGSRNGVRVNGVRVDEALLKVGDEIAIAQLIFRYEDPLYQPPAPLAEAQLATPGSQPDLPAATADDDLIPVDEDFFPLD